MTTQMQVRSRRVDAGGAICAGDLATCRQVVDLAHRFLRDDEKGEWRRWPVPANTPHRMRSLRARIQWIDVAGLRRALGGVLSGITYRDSIQVPLSLLDCADALIAQGALDEAERALSFRDRRSM